MTLDILVVDDSPFFQRLLAELINEHPQLHVIGFANNGKEAVEKVKSLKPDLVTMDYEMPMMDGVSAVKVIMAENPLPILMLSSMTFPDAKITIDALEAGAVDFITKNFSAISNKSAAIQQHLHKTLLAIGDKVLQKKTRVQPKKVEPPVGKITSRAASPVAAERKSVQSQSHASMASTSSSNSTKSLYQSSVKPKLVVIGASTGGPAALTQILKTIPADFPLPMLIIQHMPENFTQAFAERLDRQCHISVKQADDGDSLLPGRALLAPGGKQMVIDKRDASKVKVMESTEDVHYKPCVDISFASVSNAYGRDTLAIVLTGMGHDGRDGAKLLKEQQATVWTQDKDSCVVYGMPMAIDQANLSNASLTPAKISSHLSVL